MFTFGIRLILQLACYMARLFLRRPDNKILEAGMTHVLRTIWPVGLVYSTRPFLYHLLFIIHFSQNVNSNWFLEYISHMALCPGPLFKSAGQDWWLTWPNDVGRNTWNVSWNPLRFNRRRGLSALDRKQVKFATGKRPHNQRRFTA